MPPIQHASIFGPMEIGLLLLVSLLLFGAKRIPEIASSFGKGIREFKKSMSDVQSSIETPTQSEMRSLPPAPTQAAREEATPEREPKRLL